ncbi:MAG: hypothetical protein V3T70_02695, partial [Phycisphaerae bacterium]
MNAVPIGQAAAFADSRSSSLDNTPDTEQRPDDSPDEAAAFRYGMRLDERGQLPANALWSAKLQRD